MWQHFSLGVDIWSVGSLLGEQDGVREKLRLGFVLVKKYEFACRRKACPPKPWGRGLGVWFCSGLFWFLLEVQLEQLTQILLWRLLI